MNFAEKLNQLIAAQSLPQKKIAEELNLSEGALINYRRGRIPKAEELLRIARYFKVSMESLLDPFEAHLMFIEGKSLEARATGGSPEEQQARFESMIQERIEEVLSSKIKLTAESLREQAEKLRQHADELDPPRPSQSQSQGQIKNSTLPKTASLKYTDARKKSKK